MTNTGWPEYVFAPGYPLKPLTEVGAHVKKHHQNRALHSKVAALEEMLSITRSPELAAAGSRGCETRHQESKTTRN